MKLDHCNIFIMAQIRILIFMLPFTLLLFLLGPVGCEVFISQSDLESLIYLRREVNRAIDVYLGKEEGRLEYLKQRLKSSRGLARQSGDDDVDDSGNPISAFLLVKGLTLDLAEVVTVAGDRENFKEFGKRIEELHATTSFPDGEDISGAALGLIRLQDTYELDARSIAKGALGDSCCAPELSVEDSFELGKQSYNAKMYDYAIEWFREALYRLPDVGGGDDGPNHQQFNNDTNNFHNDNTTTDQMNNNSKIKSPSLSSHKRNVEPLIRISKSEILNYLHWAEDIQKTLDLGKEFLAQLTGVQFDAFVEQVAQAVADQDESMSKKEVGERYKSLCRGDGMAASSINPNLKCYYSTRGNSYYLLGPIKEELLNLDPPIWSFKNIIHHGEIEKIKELAKPRIVQFETAMIVNVFTGVNERSNSRISKSAWLTKEDDSVVDRIDTRTGLITGLSMETAELLQIANYGIGGMYLPHYDFALAGQEASFLEQDRNRIATMLFYMSDVEKGGATVFPKLNLTLWPEKGSAVFWYNLKKSGDGELQTQHAACPVLVGSKWVSNKWIHEKGQEFRYKCGLRRNE